MTRKFKSQFRDSLFLLPDFRNVLDDFVNVEMNLAFAAAGSMKKQLFFTGSLGKLTNITKNRIDWTQFFNRFLKNLDTNITLSEKTNIKVNGTKYFRSLSKRLTLRFTEQQLVHYFVFSIFKQFQPIDDEKYAPESQKCLEQLEDFDFILRRLYIDNFIPPKSKVMIKGMAENIRRTIVEIVSKKEWLDNKTRVLVVDKLKKIKLRIGYPERIMNDTFLDDYFSDLKIIKNSYLLTYASNKVLIKRKEFLRLGSKANELDE